MDTDGIRALMDAERVANWRVSTAAGATHRVLSRMYIIVHCRGGLGRAGMISAHLLVESGIEPEAAIERVRAARPGAIETLRQEEWVGAVRRDR